MALRSAWWWMQSQPPNPIQSQAVSNLQEPHKNWTQNQQDGGISFKNLEKTLEDNPGQECRVDYFTYSSTTQHADGPALPAPTVLATRPKWTFQKTVTTVQGLIDVLTQHVRVLLIPLCLPN
jgi:hypothetical protein